MWSIIVVFFFVKNSDISPVEADEMLILWRSWWENKMKMRLLQPRDPQLGWSSITNLFFSVDEHHNSEMWTYQYESKILWPNSALNTWRATRTDCPPWHLPLHNISLWSVAACKTISFSAYFPAQLTTEAHGIIRRPKLCSLQKRPSMWYLQHCLKRE